MSDRDGEIRYAKADTVLVPKEDPKETVQAPPVFVAEVVDNRRDSFALAAMQGILSSGTIGHEFVAEQAVQYAEYLIKRLDQK